MFDGGVDAMVDSGHPLGTFIVHHCLTLEEEKKQFFSRVPRMILRKIAS